MVGGAAVVVVVLVVVVVVGATSRMVGFAVGADRLLNFFVPVVWSALIVVTMNWLSTWDEVITFSLSARSRPTGCP